MIQNSRIIWIFSILVLSIFSIFAILGIQSCTKQEESPIEYNSFVHDPAFINNLAGYKIYLVAPGSGVNPKKIQKIIEIPGLSIEVPKNTFSDSIIFHANTDRARFENLKTLLENENYGKTKNNENNDNNPSILWSLRGGYGSARLIESLNHLPKPKSEKIFIGYSDMTALHLFFSQKWGWKTIHGAMLLDLVKTQKDPNNFLKLSQLLADLKNPDLKSVKTEIHVTPCNNKAKNLMNKNLKDTNFQEIRGTLTGGNLAMVQTSIGTDWQIDTKNKIVFLEDDGEKGYQIDRMLNHFKQVGLFKEVKAVILGDFSGGDDYVALALKLFCEEVDFPVFRSDEFGHGPKNYPLIYNSESKIVPSDKSDNFKLIMEIQKKKEERKL